MIAFTFDFLKYPGMLSFPPPPHTLFCLLLSVNASKIHQQKFIVPRVQAVGQDFEWGNDLPSVVKEVKASEYQWEQYTILADLPFLPPRSIWTLKHSYNSVSSHKKKKKIISASIHPGHFSLCFITDV